jgi:LL-diaminopimelate aminotransferase
LGRVLSVGIYLNNWYNQIIKLRLTGKRWTLMIFSKRMEGLTSAIFSELDYKKKELLNNGRDVFDLSIGTPDLPPAPHIVDVLKEAAGYPENYVYAINDMSELISAAIGWYKTRYGVSLEFGEVTSLLGSQDGLSHIALTLADPGDVVMVPDPGYPVFSVGPGLACASVYKFHC